MSAQRVERVAVLGAGTIGTEVASHCAAWGLETRLYDVTPDALDQARQRVHEHLQAMVDDGILTAEDSRRATARVLYTDQPGLAADRVQVVSECVPERAAVKRDVLRQFDELCPPEALLTTNSSYLLPSMLCRKLTRPERFAAFHFHSPPWIANVVDVMPQRRTADDCIARLVDFGRQLGQTPIVVRKEYHGYVFNSMLRQLLMSALTLAEREVAGFEDVDRAWMGVTGMSIGPFGILDRIGLDTVHEIISQWSALLGDAQGERNAALLAQYVQRRRLGRKSGAGFYDYPRPRFQQAGFLVARGDRLHPSTANNGQPPNSTATGMQRFVLRAEPCVAVPADMAQRAGSAWILGENEVADQLANRLRQAGMQVDRVPGQLPSDHLAAWLREALERCWPNQLWLLPAFDAETTAHRFHDWPQRRRRCFEAPFQISQAWFARWLTNTAPVEIAAKRPALICATRLGGDGGVGRRQMVTESAAMAGLLKGIFLESRSHGRVDLMVKVVDFDTATPSPSVVDGLLAELADSQRLTESPDDRSSIVQVYRQIESGYHRGKRQVLTIEASPLRADSARPLKITAGGHWLITGGARGVTALVARRLAERYRLALHLVGTSPQPEETSVDYSDEQLQQLKREVMIGARREGLKPNDAWDRVARRLEIRRNLQALADSGIVAHYHRCDLGDRAAVERLVQTITTQHGPLRGLVHGAGVEITGRFDRKPWEVVQRTWRAKVDGVVYLLDALDQQPLEAVLAFGSLSGRLGGIGQADYAAANDALARLVSAWSVSPAGVPATTFHWPAWDEVGMAARPASRRSLESGGHQFLSPQIGAQFVLDELTAGLPEPEVVIMDPGFLPKGVLDREGPHPLHGAVPDNPADASRRLLAPHR